MNEINWSEESKNEFKKWEDAGFLIDEEDMFIIDWYHPDILKKWIDAGFNFKEMRFWQNLVTWNPNKALKWIANGFDWSDAMKWSESFFNPDEAKKWRIAGFMDPGEALRWSRHFDVEEVAIYRKENYDLFDALDKACDQERKKKIEQI